MSNPTANSKLTEQIAALAAEIEAIRARMDQPCPACRGSGHAYTPHSIVAGYTIPLCPACGGSKKAVPPTPPATLRVE